MTTVYNYTRHVTSREHTLYRDWPIKAQVTSRGLTLYSTHRNRKRSPLPRTSFERAHVTTDRVDNVMRNYVQHLHRVQLGNHTPSYLTSHLNIKDRISMNVLPYISCSLSPSPSLSLSLSLSLLPPSLSLSHSFPTQ